MEKLRNFIACSLAFFNAGKSVSQMHLFPSLDRLKFEHKGEEKYMGKIISYKSC